MSLAQTLRIVFSGDVKAFQEAGSHVEKEANKLAGNLKQIFSAAAATALVKQVMDLAEAVNDASERTGIGAEKWQEYTYAANQTGAGAAELEVGVKKLQDTIGAIEPTKAAKEALDRLGLSFTGLKAMSPEQQFETVAKAIGEIQDPTSQAQMAVELFGRSGTLLIPMAENFTALTGEARKFGQVMSAETVKSLDEAKDSIERTQKAVTVGFGWMLGQIGQTFAKLGELSTGLSEHEIAENKATVEALKAAASEKQKAAQAATEAQVLAADKAAKEEERLAKERSEAEKQAQKDMTEARKESAKEAERLTREIADTEKDIADAREKIADLEETKAKERRDKKLADTLAEFDAEIKGYQKQAAEHGAEATALEAQLAKLMEGRGKTSAELSREARQQAHDERDAKRAAAEEEADTQDALDRAKHGYHLSTRQRYLVEVAKKREALEEEKADEKAAMAAAKAAAEKKAAAEEKARQDEVTAHRKAQDEMLTKLKETLTAMMAKIQELTGGDYKAEINGVADTEDANTALNGVSADRTAKFAADADTTQAQSEIDKLSSNTVKIPAILDPPELKAALDLTLNAPLAEISSTLSTWLPQIDTDIKAIVGTAA